MKQTVTINAKIEKTTQNKVTIKVDIPLIRSMVNGEEVIQNAVNAVGALATKELLKIFDTDGSAISFGNLRLTSKGQLKKNYQTPYGEISLNRHVYQSAKGGETYCPLEKNSRIIRSGTPKFAKIVSHKYSKLSVDEVQKDLLSNHSRKISRDYIQSISESVGSFAEAKEESWEYSIPKLDEPVHSVGVGLDGTTMYMKNDGYREAMVGSISLYNKEGERLHSIYIGATPEYGKQKFFNRLEREIGNVKNKCSKACYVGVADGAKNNWPFLKQHTSVQITDFYHASEYLTNVSFALYKDDLDRKEWLENQCHDLKHEHGSAKKQLALMKRKLKLIKGKDNINKLKKSISYFTSQLPRMNYAEFREKNLPIGSGVTEAACKTIIKQRFCKSGMKWKDNGARAILSLRCLDQSNRWDQFWDKINQYGFNAA